jgi:hypothetical protein
MRAISRFHYATVFIDGTAFTSDEQLHKELAFKLGLPEWYDRNFDALLDCLSSIDDSHENLCTHGELHPGKRMVLQVSGLSETSAAEGLLMAFLHGGNVVVRDCMRGLFCAATIWLRRWTSADGIR